MDIYKWPAIEKILDDEGFDETCDTCRFYKECVDYHPYGSTTVPERNAECFCYNDHECP